MTAATNRPSKIGALRELLYALLQEHARDDLLPTSARFLFYELVTRGQYSKVATGARRDDQDLIDALKRLRDEGRVPWEWITDETRSVEDHTGYRTIKEGVLTTLPGIGLNPWHYSPPLILTESRSLAGVLRAIASEYRVRIASTNGQVGGFLHTEVVPLLQAGDTVGYLGDYDLAGGQIEANARRVLERKIDGELNWTRIALTAQQVEQYDLPSIVKRDKRYEDDHPHEAVETEALRQTVLVEILRRRLDELLPELLARVQEREARQRKRLANRLRGRQCSDRAAPDFQKLVTITNRVAARFNG